MRAGDRSDGGADVAKTPGVFLTGQKDARRLCQAGDLTPCGGLSPAGIARGRRVLMRRDARLRALILRAGPCRLADGRNGDPFAGLVRIILSQQLSTIAASTIFGRVAALSGGPDGLTPSAVAALDAQALRTAGVSRPKIAYLHDLAEHVGTGRLDLAGLAHYPDDRVVEAITAVKGLGRWSAEMFLIFRFNRPDVWPTGDLGIVKGVQKLFDMRRPPALRTLERVARPWRPYRSIAAWYLWRIHDS